MRRLMPLLFSATLIAFSSQVFAQADSEARAVEEQHDQAHVDDGDDESSTEHGDEDGQDSLLQKRKLEIGLILTACIFLLGLFLVVSTLIYGRRTRRQLAAGRGDSQLRDELWYLKNERNDESDRDESQEETK